MAGLRNSANPVQKRTMVQSVKFFIQIAIYKSRKKIIIHKKKEKSGIFLSPAGKGGMASRVTDTTGRRFGTAARNFPERMNDV